MKNRQLSNLCRKSDTTKTRSANQRKPIRPSLTPSTKLSNLLKLSSINRRKRRRAFTLLRRRLLNWGRSSILHMCQGEALLMTGRKNYLRIWVYHQRENGLLLNSLLRISTTMHSDLARSDSRREKQFQPLNLWVVSAEEIWRSSKDWRRIMDLDLGVCLNTWCRLHSR